jgi:hypothetical protein
VTLARVLNYGVILVNPPKHMAVGLYATSLEGSYYTYGDRRYYYCETTGDNWAIGEIPPEHNGDANLYQIDESKQYVAGKSTFGQPMDELLMVGAVGLLAFVAAIGLARGRAKQAETLGPIVTEPLENSCNPVTYPNLRRKETETRNTDSARPTVEGRECSAEGSGKTVNDSSFAAYIHNPLS